jgi:hypothetical protein
LTVTDPLPLPPNFDPDVYLIAKSTENGVFHESRKGAALAEDLVANGTPQDLALAEKVLDVVLSCQETHEEARHYGNFTWMLEDDVVQDLNAVEFNLEHLIPMMLHHGDRLPPEMQARVLDAIRLGLDEIHRLDVLVVYTNIALLDIFNTSVGGELLGEPEIARRGYRKLVEWMAVTDENGHPFEYNSPTYTAVAIRALAWLVGTVRDKATAVRARLALARLGVSAALHIHRLTGRWAGPHSRAYHPSIVCETEAEIVRMRRWIEVGVLPAWMADILGACPETFSVVETAFAQRHLGLSTYQTPAFALGVSVKEASGQSDVMMSHYVRSDAERPGVFYTRYLTNDKWLGDFYHATDRTRSRNLIEEGHFYGVQRGPRAIGLYAPGRMGVIHSAKVALIWTERARIDEIWVGRNRVSSLPLEVPEGEVVVVGSGEAWFAVMPLARTDLGRDAPVRLVEIQGDLVLEIYNYLGTDKTFWELGWPGAFYQGKPHCGVYLEMADRSDYDDGGDFAWVVSEGSLRDEVQVPFTYAGERERLRTIAYAREGAALGLEVDLMAWALKRRWTEAGPLGWPMLEAPIVRQTRTGRVAVGDATLTCGEAPAWLLALAETGRYVAAYHGRDAAPLTLRVPEGRVEIPAMGMGTVVWDNGQIIVDAIGVQGDVRITGGELVDP